MTTAPAALIVRNGRVWSAGRVHPEADAVAVGEGRVVALGRADALEPLRGPATRVIDACGATVTPGLIDAHVHLLAWARSMDEVDLRPAASAADASRRVGAHAVRQRGTGTIVGRGWDEDPWPEPPHRRWLDSVCPDRPVLLHSHDFHTLWVNGEALRRAGVGRSTRDPDGGRIERDAAGEPTGVLRENAVRLLQGLEPPEDDAADLARLRRAAAALLERGVTGIHDFEGPRAHRLLHAMTRDPASRLRVLMHLAHAGLEAALGLGLESGTGDEWFCIGGVKLFSDGALGSRTAALLEPYEGTTQTGMDLIPPGELNDLVARATAGGLAVAVHAIGDRAVRHTLNAFEAAGPSRARPALPSRLEHAQLVHPDDLGRFAALGLSVSMQPSHAVSDIGLAERWWRGRLALAYPWRALLDRKARLAFGSDAPVEPPDPALGLHGAVTRERVDGTPAGGWIPAQRITLDEALSAYTEGAAGLAANRLGPGLLAPGAPADLVVWDADLHALPPSRLHSAGARLTVQAGQVVFDAESAPRGSAAGMLEVAP